MNIENAINEVATMINEASVMQGGGRAGEALSKMAELKAFMNDTPIENTQPDDDTSENCSLCGQPKQD